MCVEGDLVVVLAAATVLWYVLRIVFVAPCCHTVVFVPSLLALCSLALLLCFCGVGSCWRCFMLLLSVCSLMVVVVMVLLVSLLLLRLLSLLYVLRVLFVVDCWCWCFLCIFVGRMVGLPHARGRGADHATPSMAPRCLCRLRSSFPQTQ